MIQKILDNKFLCILSMIISTGFTIWYLSFSNPLYYYGALSVIGLNHPVLFKIWGFLTELALLFNIIKMYNKYQYKNNWAKAMLIMGVTSIIITVTVPYVFNNVFKYVAHCYGAISFIVYNAVAILILFVKFYKKSKEFKVLSILTVTVLLAVLVLFATIGESGLLEVTPMWYSFIILGVVNFTNVCKIKKNKIKITVKEEKELINV